MAVGGDPNEADGFAPTLYPGGSDITGAEFVRVDAGQTVGDINIPLGTVHFANLSGTVVGFDTAMRGTVLAEPLQAQGLLDSRGAAILPDGRFVLRRLPPGIYRVRASLFPPADRPILAAPEIAETVVHVTGQPLDIALSRVAPVRISGGVQDVNGNERPRASSMRIVLEPAVGGPPQVLHLREEDLRFDGAALPGRYVVRVEPVNGKAPVWRLQSIRAAGTASGSEVLELGPYAVEEIELFVTNRAQTLMVDGSSASAQVLVVFPEDERLWTSGDNSRVAVARRDADGAFVIKTLLPGRYLAALATEFAVDRDIDEILLQGLIPRAMRFALSPGQTLALTISGR